MMDETAVFSDLFSINGCRTELVICLAMGSSIEDTNKMEMTATPVSIASSRQLSCQQSLLPLVLLLLLDSREWAVFILRTVLPRDAPGAGITHWLLALGRSLTNNETDRLELNSKFVLILLPSFPLIYYSVPMLNLATAIDLSGRAKSAVGSVHGPVAVSLLD